MRHLIFIAFLLGLNSNTFAMCGMMVPQINVVIRNESSQVVMVRDGNHTVVTMYNDFQGAAGDFVMVVPVPEVLQQSDIRVGSQGLFAKLNACTSPQLEVKYDSPPCLSGGINQELAFWDTDSRALISATEATGRDDLGVTVEANYTVGQYEIYILSAKESNGLKKWLIGNGYKLPAKAAEALDPYVRGGMKFFVAKVSLEAQSTTGFLPPLQIQFNSDRFMLPIRLGMANAKSTQDMVVYTFTRNGRVETANYRTTKMPTNRKIPAFIHRSGLFADFCKSVYDKAWEKEGKNSVMLEYARNISGGSSQQTAPLNRTTLSLHDLQEAGVWWLESGAVGDYQGELFLTRLRVRYDRKTFPQDLVFVNTPNRTKFESRYQVRYASGGEMNCLKGRLYRESLALRKKVEVEELMALTGWKRSEFQMYLGGINPNLSPSWIFPEGSSEELSTLMALAGCAAVLPAGLASFEGLNL